MYMKTLKVNIRIALLLTIIMLSFRVNAQQDPMFTHYLNNPMAINPAIAGTQQGLNLSLLSRLQWIGLDGAPASYSFGAHTPYVKQNMGLGLNIMTDKAGPLRNTHITGSYAYQITVVEGMQFSMGLKAGVSSYNASIAGLDVNDPSDPQFLKDDNRISPNLGVGFYLYTANYFAGFSVPKLIEAKLNKEYRESKEPYNPQLYLMGGYNFIIDRNWEIQPSTLMGIMGGSPISTDIAVKALYLRQFHFGSHYRIGDALGLFFGARIYEKVTVGYAFDFSLSQLSRVNSGTHEIMISYTFDDIWNRGEGWRF
jgi:type IX secretion system PorP/SprF family membrane protein